MMGKIAIAVALALALSAPASARQPKPLFAALLNSIMSASLRLKVSLLFSSTTLPRVPMSSKRFVPGASPVDETKTPVAPFANGQIVSGGMMIEALLPFFSGMAGGLVINRTGLQGFYALRLTWAPQRGPNQEPPPDDLPDFSTALQEQLGLKLQPEKARLPVFIVDSIERPSEN